MTTRWIWFVPSYIWVIVASRAVSAGRRPADCQGSAPAQHSFFPVLEHLQVGATASLRLIFSLAAPEGS